MKIKLLATFVASLMLVYGFTPEGKKDPCKKVFKKVKKRKKKSTSFSDAKTFETKGVWVDGSYGRKIAFSFSYFSDTSHLIVTTLYNKGAMSFKRRFNFDKNSVLALVFKDGSIRKVKFTDVQNTEVNHTEYTYAYSTITISNELLELLSSKQVAKIEILNPFGQTVRSDDVYSKEVKSKAGSILIGHSGCFLNRI